MQAGFGEATLSTVLGEEGEGSLARLVREAPSETETCDSPGGGFADAMSVT